MCLDVVDKDFRPPRGTVRAWKVFRMKAHGYGPLAIGHPSTDACGAYPRGRWLEAFGGLGSKYVLGFHALVEESDAWDYSDAWDLHLHTRIVVLVHLRDVHTAGWQAIGGTRRQVVVAGQMMLPEPKPSWDRRLAKWWAAKFEEVPTPCA